MEINTFIQGDVRKIIKELPDQYFNTIVTSPPYFGLRDYGTAIWQGGNPSCLHKPANTEAEKAIESSTMGGGVKIMPAISWMNLRTYAATVAPLELINKLGWRKRPKNILKTW